MQANAPDLSPTLSKPRLGRRLINWAGTLGMLVLVGATLIRFSARLHWTGELLASLAWYLGVCGALGALLLFLAQRRKLALYALLISSLHFGPELALWIPSSSPTAPAGQEMTLATANLLWHNHDYDSLAQWIETNDPDIIAFQEVSPHSRDFLFTMSERYPSMVFDPPLDEWNTLTWGIAFLSKEPFHNQSRQTIPATPWKGILEVEARLDGERLVLRNLHPTRPGRAWRNAERDSALMVAQESAWNGQSILMGDLNVTSTSPRFADLIEVTGLRDSREGFGRQPTYMLKKTSPLLKVAIDHVLVSDSLAVLDRRVVPLPGSDHDTLVVQIKRASNSDFDGDLRAAVR